MKKILYLGFYLGCVAAFFAIALAITNQITAPRIEAIQEENFKNALRDAFPTFTNFTVLDSEDIPFTLQVIEIFEENETIGFVYSQKVQGFVDEVRYLVGVNMDGYFTSFSVLFSRENPGFGSRIMLDEWINRVAGNHGSNEIDALTSATVTTQPIINALQLAYTDFVRRTNP